MKDGTMPSNPEPSQPLTWDDLDAIRDRSRGINNAAEAYDSAEDVPTLLAEIDRLHSWTGLMALLDEHWPEDIFPTREDDTARDPGPRIISLLRRTIRLRAENARLRKQVQDYHESATAHVAKFARQHERLMGAEVRIAAARKLHQPLMEGGQGWDGNGNYTFIKPCCPTCGTSDEYAVRWPCTTAKALGMENGDNDA